MLLVNEAHSKSLESITEHLKKIPRKYRAKYIQYAWQHIEKTEIRWDNSSPLKHSLLDYMNREIIEEIPLEFGIRIIQQHLMTEHGRRDLNNIFKFIFDFLSSKDEKQLIFDEVFSIVDQCPSEREISEFLLNWYRQVMESTCDDLRYMEPYVNYFEKKVSLIENFSDFVKIFFLKCKLESRQWAVDDFTNKILDFFEEIVSKCGTLVIPLFSREIDYNLTFFVQKDFTNTDLYYSMMKQRPIPIIAVLLLQLVSEPPSDFETRKAFDEFVQLIKSVKDVGVQICLCKKYKSYFRTYSVDSSDFSADVDVFCSLKKLKLNTK
ncbi:hypothetical protein Zmor_010426 [Zophobas morio]|uniref:Uncharacterized protein n=1 Tax=Zophobas morio TaxID=2755281 RepID=A0AA38MJP2_9CUCU|nr:hypothetical protein Zmor_010426 [Zophobas morio]